MFESHQSNSIPEIVHQRTGEILAEVGFCVPDAGALARLEQAGFPVDWDTQMVQVTPGLLETALSTLPEQVRLYDRTGNTPAPYDQRSCFMGGGTPVNVIDLDNGIRRPATRSDWRRWPRPPHLAPCVRWA